MNTYTAAIVFQKKVLRPKVTVTGHRPVFSPNALWPVTVTWEKQYLKNDTWIKRSILLLMICTILTPNRVQAVEPHPRLFFIGAEIAQLQNKINSTHATIWQPIQQFTQSQLGTNAPADAPADSDEDYFRNAGNLLIPLAFTCAIGGAADHCALAKQHLLAYARWQKWDGNDNTDLGQAHMLLGSALAYDWLYNQLSSSERDLVRTNLAARADRLYQASVRGSYDPALRNWWRKSYIQNHHWTNYSALGMAGLALLGEDPRAETWIGQAVDHFARIQFLLNNIQDGSWHEGIAYQSYGLTTSLAFWVNLRKNMHIDLIPYTYLQHYVDWLLYNYLPGTNDYLLAYGDYEWWWGNAYERQHILRFIAREFRDGRAEWLAQKLLETKGRTAQLWNTPWYVFELLYYDPTIAAQPPVNAPSTHVFPDLAGVSWRTGWGADDLVFGFKTGAYGGRFAFDTFTGGGYPWDANCITTDCQFNIGHDHDDSNSFVIYRAGRWLAPETVGVDKSATSYHNTILIDGQGQYRPPKDWMDRSTFSDSDAVLSATANTTNFDFVEGDATRRYRLPGIEKVRRSVLFVRPYYFVMMDDLAATVPHRYEWRIHFEQGVWQEENWLHGDVKGGQALGVAIIAPTPFSIDIGNDGQPYGSVFTQTPVERARFINLLYPTTDDGWAARPKISLREDTPETVFIRIDRNQPTPYTDDILYLFAPPAQAGTTYPIGSYRLDGKMAAASRLDNDAFERVFLLNGVYLEHQTSGRILIQTSQRNLVIEVAYQGDTLSVSGEVHGEIILYAPNAQTLSLNAQPWAFTRQGDYVRLQAP